MRETLGRRKGVGLTKTHYVGVKLLTISDFFILNLNSFIVVIYMDVGKRLACSHVCATCVPGTLKGPEGSIRVITCRSQRRLLAAMWVLESTPRPKSSSGINPGPISPSGSFFILSHRF